MKKIMLPFMLLTLLFAVSCNTPETDEVILPENASIVTGLQLREHDGSSLGTLGNPNTNSGNVEAFPNPVNNVLSVHSTDTIQKVWITVGLQDTTWQDIDFESLFQNFTYKPEDLNLFGVKITNPSSALFNLDVSELPTGYRRIFYLMKDNTIRWDNLFIDHERSFPESINHVIEDWD